MEIYERIFELLKEKGMTQAELSQKTGIRVSTISDWKNKKGNPSADKTKQRLAREIYGYRKVVLEKLETLEKSDILKQNEAENLIEALNRKTTVK